MPPVIRGDIWPVFVREEGVVSTTAPSSMPAGLCTEAISLGVGTTLQQKLAGTPLKIASGLAQAKELGLIIGRNRSIVAHLRTCSGISFVVNGVVGNWRPRRALGQ
jgi:hypothetical protein